MFYKLIELVKTTFLPAFLTFHIFTFFCSRSLTMRQTGTHSFSISDGGDPTNVWSSDFRLHGWLDDLYGAAAVSVFDPEDRDAWHFPTEVIDATYLYVGCLKHYFLFGIYGESKSRYMIFKIYQRYLYHISL